MIFQRSYLNGMTALTAVMGMFLLHAGELNAQYVVYNGALCQGCKIGVDSEKQDRTWLINEGDQMKMKYPGDQNWGAVYITFGPPQPDNKASMRQFKDFSGNSTLSFEMKGEEGKELIQIGMKDQKDLNDGTETKIPPKVEITTDWKTFTFKLTEFESCDMSILHLPIEFVFETWDPMTVYFRNIKIE